MEEGIRDGSIRSDLKIPRDIFAIYFITTGFMNRVFEAGETYARMHQIDTEELIVRHSTCWISFLENELILQNSSQ